MAKQALGKGLGALIKQSSSAVSRTKHEQEITSIPIGEIIPSPLQPRVRFAAGQLDELKESIRQHGVIQPLIVRQVDGKMEIIAGERRWRASKDLGLSELPIRIRQATDHEVLEMALIENIQRKDLDPIEEAHGYKRLATEFEMKQETIAERVGKSRAAVANTMRLLELHEDVQNQVANGHISIGHAKIILSLKDKKIQVLVAEQIQKKSLTVRAAEKLVKSFSQVKKTPVSKFTSQETDAVIEQITRSLRERFATDVRVNHKPKKGKIELSYYGDEDMQRILDLLGIQI